MNRAGIGCGCNTYQSAQVVPDLADIGVQPDGAGVGVQRVAVLIDLVVENTNGTPEGRVPPIAVHGLLVSLIRLGVFLLRHVATAK